MLTKCGGKFTYNTVAMLADQMIERVEYIHSKNILHRDLKVSQKACAIYF